MDKREDYFFLEKHDRALPEELHTVKNLYLRIWNVKFDRYEDLALCSGLTQLAILDYHSDSFAPLGCLPSLRRLHIVHFPKVDTLEPLKDLTNLEELRLETRPSGDASGKRQVVDSFKPLAHLKKLRVLHLGGMCTSSHDLSPLGELTELQDLALPNWFPQREFSMLSVKLPCVHPPRFLAPYLPLERDTCKKCNSEKVMLSGSDVPNPKVICPICRKKKFEETVARFEMYKSGKT